MKFNNQRLIIAATLISCLFTMLVSVPAWAEANLDNCFNLIDAGDYARAVEMGKKAIKISPSSYLAHFCLGKAYLISGNINLAYTEMKKSEQLCSNKSDLMYIYLFLGRINGDRGDDESALNYNSRSLQLAREFGNRDIEATVLNNTALIYNKQGNKDKALEYYEQALQLTDDEKDRDTINNNIALVYSKYGEDKKAVEYLTKAIDISQRHGNYHNEAMETLNLGDCYRRLGQTNEASANLLAGLEKIKKTGDKFWEAVAYKYLGWLYVGTNNIPEARRYLNLAYEQFNKLGAIAEKNDVYNSIVELNKPKPYAGIEIGSKGVKCSLIVITPAPDGDYDISEKYHKIINTTIISGVVNTGEFSEASILETAQAVLSLYNDLKGFEIVGDGDISIIGSSALNAVANKEKLNQKVAELTGKNVVFIDEEQEVLFNIAGSIPSQYWTKGLSIDIGSGNTKIGYMVESDKTYRIVSSGIPLGTVTLAEKTLSIEQNPELFEDTCNKVIESEFLKFRNDTQKNPGLMNRRPVYVVGGIVWAISVLSKPSDTRDYSPLSLADINLFIAKLKSKSDTVFNPNLTSMKDEKARQEVRNQIQKIKDTFTHDNLLAGACLLRSVYKTLNIQEANFSRYGSLLWGFISFAVMYNNTPDTEPEEAQQFNKI